MSIEELKTTVYRVAVEAAGRGPGWSQEGVVLRELSDRMARNSGGMDLPTQRTVLDIWHDLFADKRLAWGYDLDNPGAPFFHVR